ncbi:MAG: tyrosine-protein phosphatase [Bacteroidales bacterium]|nr:tyrosine-protein phosphatase [Bacteroidales bacterium]
MKRFASFLLILSTLALFACQKPEEPIEEPDDPTPEQPEEPQQPEEPDPLVHPEGSIENDVVYAYVNAGSYEKFGDRSLFATDAVVISTAKAHKWKGDDPAGITVSWDGSAEYTVSISKPEGLWYEETVSGNEYTFTNLIPGVRYTWKVSEGGKEIKSGEFTPTGQVRMVDVPCSWNWRDMGGWPGIGGNRIKYGWIYRGGSLNGKFQGKNGKPSLDPYDYTQYAVPDSMRIALERIGMKAQLDLRGDLADLGKWGDEYDAHGATLRHCQFEGWDFMQIMTDYGLYYPGERSSLIQDVAWIINEVRKGNPVGYHCRSGADRTGAVGLLLGGLLGMSESDLQKEYELTTLSREKKEKKTKYATEAVSGSPLFFKRDQGIFSYPGETLQEKCYLYLNKYFEDVHINADDLDWFIQFMLGLSSYNHPADAVNYPDNPLENVWSIDTGSGNHKYTDER